MAWSNAQREDVLQMIREVYPTQGAQPIADHFNISIVYVRVLASKNKIKRNKDYRENRQKNEIIQMIKDVYYTDGPEPIAQKFCLSVSNIKKQANSMGIVCGPAYYKKIRSNPIWEEIDPVIRELYPLYGYRPIYDRFRISRMRVHQRAGILGVSRDFSDKE